MVSEFINGGTLTSVLTHYLQFPNILKNILFQILTSLSSLQRYFGIIHNDLHMGNILLESNEHTGYLEYINSGKQYYIPNNLLVKIIDFGKSRIKDKIEPDTIINKVNIYNNPIYGNPQHSADQRRLATLLLNNIAGKTVIGRTDAKNFYPGYFTDASTNTLFTDELQFDDFCLKYISKLKLKTPELFDILNILQEMLIGDPLEKIIYKNFNDLKFYSPIYKITDTYNLDKPERELVITNTKLVDTYSNPIVSNYQKLAMKPPATLPRNLKPSVTIPTNLNQEDVINEIAEKKYSTLKPKKLIRTNTVRYKTQRL